MAPRAPSKRVRASQKPTTIPLAPDSPTAAGMSVRAEGLRILESVLSPSGETVLGLYVYSAGAQLDNEVRQHPVFRAIVPYLIGTPAIVSAKPGISQTELAKYLACERATAGKQVAACMTHGWIRREACPQDKRKLQLFITPKGKKMLRAAISVIPQHEREYTSTLTSSERETLKHLLLKLVSK